MAIILNRRQHTTDVLIKKNLDKTRDVKRVIGNWQNWYDPARKLWRPTAPDLKIASSVPDNWTGNFDFRYQFLNGPMQIFAGDSTTPANTALIGFRRSDKPGAWLNMKALGVTASKPFMSRHDRSVRWEDLWTNCDLKFKFGKHKVEKIITLKSPGHPNQFRFALRLPPGYTLNVQNGIFEIIDEYGEVQLRSKPAYGWDSSTVNPDSFDGSSPIRVTMQQGNDVTVGGKAYPTIVLVPNQDDLDGATYPVYVDPTATIDGTGSIEENYSDAGTPHRNFGGRNLMALCGEGANNQSGYFRVQTAAIPAASSYSRFEYFFVRFAGSTQANGNTAEAYFIKDGLNWQEGTSNPYADSVPGQSDWLDAAHGSIAWNVAGARGDGTDYETDASPPQYAYAAYTSGPDVSISWQLDANWLNRWKNIGDTNNGYVVLPQNRSLANSNNAIWTSEHITASNQPYYEIDYTEPAPPTYFMSLSS